MTDYTWTIATCEHEVATGGITVAHWRVSAVDGDYTASAYGTAGFTPDATDPDFTPYDQVTEAEVLAWVWAQWRGQGRDRGQPRVSDRRAEEPDQRSRGSLGVRHDVKSCYP
jgi:hypothetical protein